MSTTNKVHDKRRKRTSLKNVDRYRKEAAFHKQRHQTLVSDIRGKEASLVEMDTAQSILRKDSVELGIKLQIANSKISRFENHYLIRIYRWLGFSI